MPSRASASWTSSRALYIRHLTVASVISSESAISVYESPTTSRRSSAIFKSTLSASTARQTASIASTRSIGASTTSSGGMSSSVTTARGLRPVADEPQNIVEDRNLVGAEDDRKGSLVAFLSLPQDARIRLLK